MHHQMSANLQVYNQDPVTGDGKWTEMYCSNDTQLRQFSTRYRALDVNNNKK